MAPTPAARLKRAALASWIFGPVLAPLLSPASPVQAERHAADRAGETPTASVAQLAATAPMPAARLDRAALRTWMLDRALARLHLPLLSPMVPMYMAVRFVEDASGKCGAACPDRTNAKCPSGQTCSGDLSTSPGA
eukprot:365664-Chlamydomonas_euryale.AAC.17